MSDDIWSKQFYKALEAVGNLTEQERFKLGNMLLALNSIKDKHTSLKRGEHDVTLRSAGQGYQPVKSSCDDNIKSPPKKP